MFVWAGEGASSQYPQLKTSSVFPVVACLFSLLKFEMEHVLASVQIAFVSIVTVFRAEFH